MSTATISISIEPAIKRAAAANVKNVGLDLATAIRTFVNRLAREPAAAEELYIPNEETARAIREAKAGIGLTRYDSIEDMKRDLGW